MSNPNSLCPRSKPSRGLRSFFALFWKALQLASFIHTIAIFPFHQLSILAAYPLPNQATFSLLNHFLIESSCSMCISTEAPWLRQLLSHPLSKNVVLWGRSPAALEVGKSEFGGMHWVGCGASNIEPQRGGCEGKKHQEGRSARKVEPRQHWEAIGADLGWRRMLSRGLLGN